jgi:D-alanine-D-alanine ligase
VKIVVLHTSDALGPPLDPVLDQLSDALRKARHEVRLLVVDKTVEPLVTSLNADHPDLVFNLAEAFGGKSALESNVAALLNLLGLRYTGSSPAGLILAGDKSLTKKVLSFHSIKAPEFLTVYRGSLDWAGDLSFPVIVKPPQEDASLGITAKSVVHDLRQLFEQLDVIQTEFQSPALVEQFIEGREFYIGVLGNVHARALPAIELDFSKFPAGKPRIASWDAKWGEDGAGSGAEYAGTESVFPTDLPPELEQRMQQVALDAFQALRLRDYARIDLRVTPAEEIYVIEVNPNCYLERASEFARAAERGGMPYEQLIATIVDLAGARYAR